MTKPRAALLGALLALLLPAALHAQTPAERIESAMARARAAGVPAALLESKIAEGRAKRVAPERIAIAVERRAVALIRARAVMLRPDHPVADGDLAIGADALAAGVSEAALRAVSTAAPDADRAVALAVLTQLVRDGQPSAAAEARVRGALARGGGEALLQLPAQAARGAPAAGRGRGQGAAGGSPPGPPPGVPAPGRPSDPPRGPPNQP